MKKVKRRRRHLVVTFLLFVAVGALVLLAHLRPPVNLPVDEPPEMIAKRLDQQNNAWYTLVQAVQLVPDPPPPLELKDEDGWPYKYQTKEGSLGRLLYVARPDDDPVLLDYMATLGPARDLALVALDKPYFLRPPDVQEQEARETLERMRRDVWDLPNLFLAEAVRRACSNDPEADACEQLFNAWRLLRLISTDDWPLYQAALAPAITAIRKASPDHYARLAEWVEQCRRDWAPPLNELEHELRFAYGASAENMLPQGGQFRGVGKTVLSVFLARDKKMLLRFEKELRQVASMTNAEFDRFTQEHPEFEREYGAQFLAAPHAISFLRHNTYSLATMDGLSIVLALERFKHDSGAYPDTLDALVPKYLPQLPETPFTGGPYTYSRENDDYSLTCKAGGRPRPNRWGGSDGFVIYQPPGSEDS